MIRKAVHSQRRKKADALIKGIYKTGKIIYKHKVYIVREICENNHYFGGTTKPRKYVIVSKADDERVFKLPLENVEPYHSMDVRSRDNLYK